jgi:hypothetical protein
LLTFLFHSSSLLKAVSIAEFSIASLSELEESIEKQRSKYVEAGAAGRVQLPRNQV